MAASSTLSFAPPRARGRGRAIGVALAAHSVLAVGLALSTQWKHSADPVTFAAEIWAAVPSPAVALPPPPVETVPAPAPTRAPAEPPPPPPPPPAPSPAPPPEIAVSKAPPKPPEKSAADLQREQAERQKVAEAKAKAASAAAAAELAKVEARQNEQRQRMLALANQGVTPSPNAPALSSPPSTTKAPVGAANAVAAGPSASYAGRVVARLRPNILFTEDARGNPAAEVEVRTSSDGTIVSRRLMKPSGNPRWDDAVLRAIDRTEVLPRDGDRPPPSVMIVVLSPRD